MGSFDMFSFSKKVKAFPPGLPRDNWQTKDLDSAMVSYWVDGDGRVIRRRCGDDTWYGSETASFEVWIHKTPPDGERVYLKMIVLKGYMVELSRDREPETKEPVKHWTVEVPAPEDENDD